MLMKRKLDEKDKIIADKEEILKSNAQIIEDKNKIIKEREKTLQTLATQLAENNKVIEDLQSGTDVQSEVNIQYSLIIGGNKNYVNHDGLICPSLYPLSFVILLHLSTVQIIEGDLCISCLM